MPEMTDFPFLLILLPFVVVALLVLCFGQKSDKRSAMSIILVVIYVLIKWLIWYHPAHNSN